MKRKINLEAEHLPGHLNTIADEESRMMKDRWDWKLHPMIFKKINYIWGPLEIDLFASRTSKIFSWRPDPQAEGTYAFKHHWKQPAFANPPWALISWTLSEVRAQRAMVVLVAPVWKSQAWYPVMINLLFDHPRLILAQETTVVQIHQTQPPFKGEDVQLAAWPLSGDPAKKANYLEKLQAYSWHHGDQNPSHYNSLFHKWERWCHSRGRDPICGPVGDIANFLAELFKEGYSYSSLKAYRSAISSLHVRIEGRPIGQYPIISRVLKGAYNIRPIKPRYQSNWKVSQVVQGLDSQKSANLPLLDLSMKTVTLCVLTRPCRAAELANLDFQSIKVTPEGSIILPLTPPKQCRVGDTPKDYFFPSFEENENTCPSSTLHQYCMRTQEHRREGTKQLFLTSTKPHKPATSATIARWIKTTLKRAGIDTTIFKAHSVTTSAAAEAGISIPDILEAAD